MTSATEKLAFEQAIQPLQPEGGTNSNAGLQLGYATAIAGYDAACVNRVVFLSDGVPTAGETDINKIIAGVQPLKEKGIYLNTVGVGMNNHNDTLLEQLADKGDGICNYIDSPKEAKRALVDNFTGAFQPVGRDVKVQVEFDPQQVLRWRQIGYENRAIADADFRNDTVDAGEIGAGHQVTALYELELARTDRAEPMAVVRLRWKDPVKSTNKADGDKAQEVEAVVHAAARTGFEAAGQGYRRAVMVAQYAEFLRRSTHAMNDRVDDLLEEAKRLQQEVPQDAEWNEFVSLVDKAKTLGLGAPEPCDELCTLEAQLRRVHWRRYERERLKEAGHPHAADAYDADITKLEGQLRQLVELRFAEQK
jgi:Ca-activated chloride channel family protein